MNVMQHRKLQTSYNEFAADIAEESLIASDIVSSLSDAFMQLK